VEINTTVTPFAIASDQTAFGFVMPTGQSCSGVTTATRRTWIRATGLPFAGTDVVIRDRKDLAVQGHVALAAYVPGFHAWSPPIC